MMNAEVRRETRNEKMVEYRSELNHYIGVVSQQAKKTEKTIVCIVSLDMDTMSICFICTGRWFR